MKGAPMLQKCLPIVVAAWALPAAAQDAISLGSDTAESSVERVPEPYVVQPGDTLWEISQKFLGNPYYWPQLWSINDYITNPHWIYPGNRIVFRMGTLIEPPSVELETQEPSREGYVVEDVAYETVDAECGPDVRFDGTRQARVYLAPGFIADKHELETWGKVVKARESKMALGERDLIYVKLDDPDAWTCGDVMSVFRRVQRKVKGPKGKGKLGALYRIVSEGRILHIADSGIATVSIRQSWAETMRGDLVGPTIPVTVQVEAGPPTGELTGVIVGRLDPGAELLGTDETVFIDLGRSDGIRVGNSFYIVERRDEFLDRRKEDPDLPQSVVGRIVVVRVDDDIATAVVTDADRNLRVGSTVTTVVE